MRRKKLPTLELHLRRPAQREGQEEARRAENHNPTKRLCVLEQHHGQQFLFRAQQ